LSACRLRRKGQPSVGREVAEPGSPGPERIPLQTKEPPTRRVARGLLHLLFRVLFLLLALLLLATALARFLVFLGLAAFRGLPAPCGCKSAVILFKYLLACSSVLILEISVNFWPAFKSAFSTSRKRSEEHTSELQSR